MSGTVRSGGHKPPSHHDAVPRIWWLSKVGHDRGPSAYIPFTTIRRSIFFGCFSPRSSHLQRIGGCSDLQDRRHFNSAALPFLRRIPTVFAQQEMLGNGVLNKPAS